MKSLGSQYTTNVISRKSRQDTSRVLVNLWNTLLEALLNAILDNYDVPPNL